MNGIIVWSKTFGEMLIHRYNFALSYTPVVVPWLLCSAISARIAASLVVVRILYHKRITNHFGRKFAFVITLNLWKEAATSNAFAKPAKTVVVLLVQLALHMRGAKKQSADIEIFQICHICQINLILIVEIDASFSFWSEVFLMACAVISLSLTANIR